jgi:hypothetical protein
VLRARTGCGLGKKEWPFCKAERPLTWSGCLDELPLLQRGG